MDDFANRIAPLLTDAYLDKISTTLSDGILISVGMDMMKIIGNDHELS